MPPHQCEHKQTIKDIHKAIYGNGKPEEGLIWKVAHNTEFITMVKKWFNFIVAIAVTGSLSAIASFLMEVSKHISRQ